MFALGIINALLSYNQINTSFKLEYKETEFNKKVLSKCPFLSGKTFRPSPWLPFGKMQTYLRDFI